jgi:leader peptidase (prepilin peptidase)/N-methyltransferase
MTLALAFALGLITGSFLNVCIYRIPRRLSIVRPGSACPHCGHRIRWYDNLPVMSYLLLRGRCRDCKGRIAIRYPLVEFATGLGFLAAFYFAPDAGSALVGCVFVALLIVVALVDLDHRIIPNSVVVFGSAVGLAAALTVSPGLGGAVLGALVGGGTLLGVAILYRLTTGVEGMGAGDIKLMAMVGLFLGWRGALFTIFIGALAGTVVGLGLIALRGGSRRTAVPFGTFLAPAALAVWLVGEEVFRWYVSVLNRV